MYGHGRRERLTREKFFEKNAKNCTPQELAERTYILVHTVYLQERERIKARMGMLWIKQFGDYMEDAAFEYLHTNEMVLTTPSVIRDVIAGKEISQMKYIAKTLTALEFDLWLIKRSAKKLPLAWEEFQKYAGEKYGTFLDKQMHSFQEYDLCYVENFERIALELAPYQKEIEKFLQVFMQANRMKISVENVQADPCREQRKSFSRASVAALPKEEAVQKKHSEKEEKEERILDETQKKAAGEPEMDERTEALEKETQQEEKAVLTAQCSDAALLREYEIVLQEKDRRILRLENDIREFKRQRDELREYSMGQYDKGVRDLFLLMNDVRYGKIVDYLYRALNTGELEDNMASYVDNFFMLLEDMEIEPVVADEGELVVNRENLTRMFNLDFDKNAFHPARVALKYAGWKYKDMVIEKPTLTLKED